MKKKLLKFIKTKYFWYLVIMPMTIAAVFYYTLWQTFLYIENRDKEIFTTAYEIGRLDQLNQDAENTQLEIKNKQQVSKDSILKNLRTLESKDCKYLKILDTNNRYSLGCYHFQAVTVKDMYRRYYKKDISITEAVNIANNEVLSTKLAYDAIFIHKETFHWRISLCKIGLIKTNCLSQEQINNLYKLANK